MIDIHCHLFQGIDDGPDTLGDALALARRTVANGIETSAIAPFVQMGCWLQLTAGSVAGGFGPRCRERSRELLERGWVQVLASDAHNMPGRHPELEPGRAAAEEIVGPEESWRLVRDRPGAIAATNVGLIATHRLSLP